jgi:hypothetical protein
MVNAVSGIGSVCVYLYTASCQNSHYCQCSFAHLSSKVAWFRCRVVANNGGRSSLVVERVVEKADYQSARGVVLFSSNSWM